MIDFDAVIQRIKEILSTQHHAAKILDKDIAQALALDAQYFAVIKRRKKIPYEALAHFCLHENINLNWILLAQNPTYFSPTKSQ